MAAARSEGPVLAWLLEPSEPSMRYLASRDLVRPRPGERALARLQGDIGKRGWARAQLATQKQRTWWARKDTCYHPKFRGTMWRLQVLGDLGVTRRDPRIANAVEHFLRLHYDPKHGGYCLGALTASGKRFYSDPWVASVAPYSHLCLTGNMVRSLIRFGYLDDDRVQSAIRWLVDEQVEDGGWDCFGRKVGTLDAWEAMSALAEVPSRRRTRAVREALASGADFFLERRLLHKGKRFERWFWCRYPWHYHYDHLVGLDFMTALGHGKDPRMNEALVNVERKRRPDGRWELDHTNGNLVVEARRRPSKMITFLALRALRRAGRS